MLRFVTISIQLLGQARQLAGEETFQIEAADSSTVHELLPLLLATTNSALASLLSDEVGQLRNSVLPILREETIDPATPGLLRHGDTLTLLPPMSGG